MIRKLINVFLSFTFGVLIMVGVIFIWDFDTDETIVAVLDTGINSEHKVFKGKIIEGYNFLDFNKDTTDADGHGTAIAGSVVQQGDNIKILPIKMLESGERNTAVTISILYSIVKGADVVNMSFSTNTFESIFIRPVIWFAQKKGVIFVAATGNYNKDEVSFPASVEGVFAIGNVDYYGNFSEYSNYGRRTDYVTNGQNAALPMHDDNEKYTNMKGTSLASGRFSGNVAYLLSLDSDLNRNQIEQIMSECSELVSYNDREFKFVKLRLLNLCDHVQYREVLKNE